MFHKIFHIDVNSAYLSWEASYRLQQGEALDLRTIPSIVGGRTEERRGIVLAKSIPAKKYQIKTGEPIARALEKCPQLKIVPPHYQSYIKASQALVDLVKSYSPLIQRFSIDEMFMDYKGKMDPVKYADLIREDVEKNLGFTVNVGVGDNKLLAKMASDFKKPNRTHTLYKEEIEDKLWPLQVRDLFMVGSRTEAKLLSRGIETIGDLAQQDPDYIYGWLKKPGLSIWEYANGIEDSPVNPDSIAVKSIGNSTTIAFDVEKEEEALMVLLALTEMVGLRLRSIAMRALRVSLAIGYFDFSKMARQRKLYYPIASTQEIYQEVKSLFHELWTGKAIRKLSVRVSSLVNAKAYQLSFFQKGLDLDSLDKAIDQVRCDYGLGSIQRSVFLNSGISPVIGGVQEDLDYPMMTSRLE